MRLTIWVTSGFRGPALVLTDGFIDQAMSKTRPRSRAAAPDQLWRAIARTFTVCRDRRRRITDTA